MSAQFQLPIVILANGTFPSHKIPLQILDQAGTVICTDGSADLLVDLDRAPHIIIGDGDSTSLKRNSFKGLWIEASDQNKTDLHKTLDWCLMNHIDDVAVLGSTGLREDHTLGNLHLLTEFSQKMSIILVSDYATIYSLNGQKAFPSKEGQQISILAVEHVKSISTFGLKYSLDNAPLQLGSNAMGVNSLFILLILSCFLLII